MVKTFLTWGLFTFYPVHSLPLQYCTVMMISTCSVHYFDSSNDGEHRERVPFYSIFTESTCGKLCRTGVPGFEPTVGFHEGKGLNKKVNYCFYSVHMAWRAQIHAVGMVSFHLLGTHVTAGPKPKTNERGSGYLRARFHWNRIGLDPDYTSQGLFIWAQSPFNFFLVQDYIVTVHIERAAWVGFTQRTVAQSITGLPILVGSRWVPHGTSFLAYLDGHSGQEIRPH